jgi:hypothetical protein
VTKAICGGPILERERCWRDLRCCLEQPYRDSSPMAAIDSSAAAGAAGR